MVFNDLTGIWATYLQVYTGDGHVAADPDVTWFQYNAYWLNHIADWRGKGFRASRLMFKFPDTDYSVSIPPLRSTGETDDYKRMDRVLEIFASKKVKAILDLHHTSEMQTPNHPTYVRENWLKLVQHYKNHPQRQTIAALNLFNEAGTRESENNSAYPTQAELLEFFVALTRDIHAIDPDMTVIFPAFCMMGYYGLAGTQKWIADLKAAEQKVGYNVTRNPKVIFDITHPYLFENAWDGGMTPEEKADWTARNIIDPCVAEFGAARCWSGETFMWRHMTVDDGDPSNPNHQAPHTPSLDLQTRWLKAIVNVFVRPGKEIGFQALTGWGDSASVANEEAAIGQSNYVQVDPPDGGETPVADITFSGEVLDAETKKGIDGAEGKITITKPDSSKEDIPVSTDADGKFSTAKTYMAVGAYSAIAVFNKDGYKQAASLPKNFTVTAEIKDMTVTLNVSVA